MSSRIEEDPKGKSMLAAFRDTNRAEALEIVLRTIPAKVVALDKMLREDPRLNYSSEEIDRVFREDFAKALSAQEAAVPAQKKPRKTAPSAKAEMLEDDGGDESGDDDVGMQDGDLALDQAMCLPSHRLLKEVLDLTRSELLEMIRNVGIVKLWIQLNIPRIEDGNNFGVSVQEDTVTDLGHAEENAFESFGEISKYYVSRAKLATKALRYKNLPDFATAVSEFDQKEYVVLRMNVLDMRNNYALLYDLIIKNIEKIKNPRSSDHLSHLF